MLQGFQHKRQASTRHDDWLARKVAEFWQVLVIHNYGQNNQGNLIMIGQSTG
jgi:hypothetical protein